MYKKKQVGLTPRWKIYDPLSPENSRVGLLLVWLGKSLTKFQTPRIIISGRSRVPGGVVGGVVVVLGWGFDNIKHYIKDNITIDVHIKNNISQNVTLN